MHIARRLAHGAFALTAASALALALVLTADTDRAEAVRPPGIPSASTAQSELDALTVAAESHNSSYDRDLFPHWSSVGGGCTARQHVLSRDGVDVQTGSDCQPDSGRWQSDFDNTWTTSVSNATIDHVVALGEAWGSGAWAWSTAQREAFANDVDAPQLWIATSSVNSSKGAYDPAQWMPPNSSVRCDYVKAWIHVKYLYALTADPAEKSALQSHMSSYCGTGGGDPGTGQCSGSFNGPRTITEGRTLTTSVALTCARDASSSSRISVDISHPYRGDITIALVAPDGTVRSLKGADADSGNDIVATYTADLSGERGSGTWSLRVVDTYFGGSTGTLNSWSISI
ncbi:proprotein convertase P-domain-containing protein [Glycomyces tarimensis]